MGSALSYLALNFTFPDTIPTLKPSSPLLLDFMPAPCFLETLPGAHPLQPLGSERTDVSITPPPLTPAQHCPHPPRAPPHLHLSPTSQYTSEVSSALGFLTLTSPLGFPTFTSHLNGSLILPQILGTPFDPSVISSIRDLRCNLNPQIP